MKSEKQLQDYFKRELEKVGCLVYKFSSINTRGVPDLLIIKPSGVTLFCEIKSESGRGVLSKLQIHQIAKLRKQKVDVFIVSTVSYADLIVRTIAVESL